MELNEKKEIVMRHQLSYVLFECSAMINLIVWPKSECNLICIDSVIACAYAVQVFCVPSVLMLLLLHFILFCFVLCTYVSYITLLLLIWELGTSPSSNFILSARIYAHFYIAHNVDLILNFIQNRSSTLVAYAFADCRR